MLNIDVDKYLNKLKSNKDVNKVHLLLRRIGIKILITLIIFLIGAILIKSNANYKEYIYDNIYNKNISFTGIKKFYNKYLGGIIPIDKLVTNTEPVFSEKLTYTEESKYFDGVKLKVTTNYLVPVLESGLVVYIGEKENYGDVVIIQGMDGVDIWYGNMLTTSVSLYDYIEEGSLLGETDNDYLYLVYTQNGKYLNYEAYLN